MVRGAGQLSSLLRTTAGILEGILGRGGLITDPAELAPYNRDWTGKYVGNSPLVLRPQSEAEVVEVMRVCHRLGVAVVPQGGNTGLVGGGVPRQGNIDEIILSLSRLNRIHEASGGEANVIACEAGCILERLEEAANERGCMVPLNLGAKGSCQLGGNLATNAAGSRFIRHGSLRSNCLGLRVVLADGTLLDLDNRMRKDNTGLDLKQLFIGSEGCLGIITACTLQTPPLPRVWQVALLRLPDFTAVAALAARARRLPSLSALEFWDQQAGELLAAKSRLPFALRAGEFAVLVETAGYQEEEIEGIFSLLEGGEVDGVLAQDASQQAEFWRLRESIPEAASHHGPVIKYDLTLPLDHLYRLVQECRGRLPHCLVVGYGHAGDGNLHLNLVGDAPETIRSALEPWIWERVRSVGGSISAEHGIGQMKAPYLHYAKSPAAITLMRQLKQQLDPKGILNPGKLLPP